MTSRASQIVVFLLTAATLATGAAIYYPFSAAAARQRNLDSARRHAEVLLPMLGDEYRFVGVRVSETMQNGGTLLIAGSVESEADLDALRALVQKSNPPVGITWSVDVLPPGPVLNNNM